MCLSEKGPPYGGTEPCPACPWEVRNMSASAHNLLNRWAEYQHHPSAESLAHVEMHMKYLEQAVATFSDLSELHFENKLHSLGDAR